MTKPRLTQGSIIYADNVPDEFGRNLKNRRVVIVSRNTSIQIGGPYQAVAITGEIGAVPKEYAVPLRWNANGHPKTGLKKNSVAACHWIVEIPESSLREVTGHHCSTLELESILLRISAFNRQRGQ